MSGVVIPELMPNVQESHTVPFNGCLYMCVETTNGKGNSGLFGAGPAGRLMCVDPKTGDVKWQQETGNGNLIIVDDCLLCLTYSGDVLLVDPSPSGFKKLAEMKAAVTLHPWTYKGKPD
jgi:outer membrane protein assembly factor BamB